MSGVYRFKRCANISVITASTDTSGTHVNIAGGYTVSLDQIPEYTDFTDMFQQYRIDAAKLEFIPAGNTNSAMVSGTGTIFPGMFASAIDYDDNVTPTSEDDILVNQTYRKTRTTRTHTRYWKPKMLRELYNGSAGTAFESVKAHWISSAFPECPHYGLKVFSEAPAVPVGISASVTYNVRLTLWFSCKQLQ